MRPSRRGVCDGAGDDITRLSRSPSADASKVPSAVGGRASQFREFTMTDNTFKAANRHEVRATRYRQLAAKYDARAGDASSPFVCAQMRRTAEDYLVRAIGELRVAERQKQEHAG
jgi:hypothetical protein